MTNGEIIEQRVREIISEVISQYVIVGSTDSGGYIVIGKFMLLEELRRVSKEKSSETTIHTD